MSTCDQSAFGSSFKSTVNLCTKVLLERAVNGFRVGQHVQVLSDSGLISTGVIDHFRRGAGIDYTVIRLDCIKHLKCVWSCKVTALTNGKKVKNDSK